MFRKGDYISIIEKSYDLAVDDKSWLRNLTEALQACLQVEAGLVGICFDERHPKSMDPADVIEARVGMAQITLDSARITLSQAPQSILDIYRSNGCKTVSEMLRDPSRAGDEAALAFYKRFIAPGDAFTMVALNPDRTGVNFSSFLPEETAFPRPMVEHCMRVASHVAAGLRLRRSLGRLNAAERDRIGEGEAVLDPSGKLQHAGSEAKAKPVQAALREAVRAVDRARGGLRKGDPALAVDLWKGLVSGRWSLIDRFDSDGRRYYVAFRNDPEVQRIRSLNFREQQAIGLLAIGDSNKMIAYKLGLSKSAVGAYVSSARKKLGVSSRTALVHLVHDIALREKQPVADVS